MTKTRSGGPSKVLAVSGAALVLALAPVLAGCPSHANNDTGGPVASVQVVPDPENHGAVVAGTPGTLNYLITVMDAGAFPLDLGGPGVVVTQACGTALPDGIVVSGVVGTPGVASPISFSVDRPEGASYSLVITVRGAASAPFNLVVGGVVTVALTPAPDHGTVLAGVSGTLNYRVSVTGWGVFPLALDGPDVAVTLADGAALPAGIAVLPGTVEASGVTVPVGFSVNRPAPNVYSLVVTVHGVASAPFDLVVTDPAGSVAEQIADLLGGPRPEYRVITTRFALEQIGPRSLVFDGSPVTITLRGGSPGDTLTLGGSGAMFTVGPGVTLILENVALRGGIPNSHAVIVVNSGGTLVMNPGALISDNVNIASVPANFGGGVRVNSGGTFTMAGGEILRGFSVWGGGVLNLGTFTMTGGEISINDADDAGAGVFNSGAFTMAGGLIYDNFATMGGGVFNEDVFTMTGGVILDNFASMGGGVFNFAAFAMEGGEIAGNAAPQSGGVHNQSVFTMTGGNVSNNIANLGAGAVTIGTGSVFNMRGGEIFDNTAFARGGGVVNASSTFRMSDGVVAGIDAPPGRGNSAPVLAALANGTAGVPPGSPPAPAPVSQHGTFDSGGVFSRIGDLFDTDLSIAAQAGEAPVRAVTVTGVPARYADSLGSFWMSLGANWHNFDPRAVAEHVASGETEYRVSFDFDVDFFAAPGVRSFELDFFDLVGGDEIPVLRATYAVSANLVRGLNEISFGDFELTRGHGLRPSGLDASGLALSVPERILPEGLVLPQGWPPFDDAGVPVFRKASDPDVHPRMSRPLR